MNTTRVYTILMLAGCIPFVVAAASPYLGIYQMPVCGNIQHAIAYYALAIVSFMAGIQWGVALISLNHEQSLQGEPEINKPEYVRQIHAMCPKRLLLMSNVFVLIPWLILCSIGIGISYYFSIAVAFLLMILNDYRLVNRGILTDHYCQVRLTVTAILLTSLVSLAYTA